MPVVTPQQASGPAAPPTTHTSPAPSVFDGGVPPGTSPASAGRARRRGRWIVLGLVTIGALVGAGAFVVTRDSTDTSSESGDEAAASAAPIRAVEAEQRDLAETEEIDGVLAYADPTIVAAATEGTITSVAAVDDVLERGDTAVAVDTVPTVVMWGDTPIYRLLEDGVDDGADIRVLEENLVALGYDDDGELVIDEEWGGSTTVAVEAWETDLGLDADGAVDPAQVTVLAGPAIVESVEAAVGTAVTSGTPVLTTRITDEVTTVAARADGRLTLVPTVGATLSTGDIAYEIDTTGTVVVNGTEPFTRELLNGVTDGDDVRRLEETLVALGYDAGGELVVDETFDQPTAQAVADWQEALGLADDYGSVQLGELLVVPTGSRVVTVDAERGEEVTAGEIVFVTGVTTRQITGEIASSDDDILFDGATVDVEFPDATVVAGTISNIVTAAPAVDAAADAESTTTFTVAVTEIPENAAGRSQVDVIIRVTTQLAEAATVVPANALVAVGDGTYAVEVVDGSTTTFVAAEPGLFADGYVEVTGIEPGTAVVVPE